MQSMNRRSFLLGASAAVAATMYGDKLFAATSGQYVPDWSNGMVPLYCLAYIEPLPDLSNGQMREIAKFPIAVVPQDGRDYYRTWKEDIRRRNPRIKILAYQMVVEETDVPGPGHDVLMQAAGNWVTYAGITPTSPYKSHRFFDPRTAAWQRQFVAACDATLSHYAYDGLFLDQCFGVTTPIPGLKSEMEAAIQSALLEVRRRYPNKILIANSASNWQGVNGEMNEGRPVDLAKESADFGGHVGPRIELFHHYLVDNDYTTAEAMMRKALECRCFFGCAPNSQVVRWYPFFDRVLAEQTPSAPTLKVS